MSDLIHIRDLSLRCIIGIYPEERRARQDIILNVTLEVDSHARAAESDDIRDATDYKSITKDLIAHVEGSTHNLIETLAERCAAICLQRPSVRSATVSIDKPGALRFARSVAVEIRRERMEN